ncbi:MAG: hypothetical protein KZQ87_16970 [Candidatus Thiodiazotropha sp. (ex Cardiolucina cf. quadrata)]|nr:hypothetical protein [Candidatus Thiodiazotropha sp. (ex Cardiolucina cf. quadrata)]
MVKIRLTLRASEISINIIGNNGTGNSNLIEVLLHIFIDLYYDQPPDLDYHLQYEANNKVVEINCSVNSSGYGVIVDGSP